MLNVLSAYLCSPYRCDTELSDAKAAPMREQNSIIAGAICHHYLLDTSVDREKAVSCKELSLLGCVDQELKGSVEIARGITNHRMTLKEVCRLYFSQSCVGSDSPDT